MRLAADNLGTALAVVPLLAFAGACSRPVLRPAPNAQAPATADESTPMRAETVPLETRPNPRQDSVGPLAGPALFGERPELEAVPFENRLISNVARHTFTADGLDFDPDISPDGELLLFASTRNAENPDIYYKAVEGTALTQLSNDPADDIQPRFSPDGKRVVFCSNRTGNWDVWMIEVDGSVLTQLTHDQADEIAPCFSPDGQQVVFALWGARSHRWEIWTLSVGQPGVRRFLAYGMFPAWSPDGTKIAFQRARQRGSRWFSVWTITLVGEEARHPTEIAHSDVAACIAPRWSPDGSQLVFCAVQRDDSGGSSRPERDAVADVWVVDLKTGSRTKLTDGAAPSFNPTFGADGRVYFVSSFSGTENIWSMTSTADAYAVGSDVPPGLAGTPHAAGDLDQ